MAESPSRCTTSELHVHSTRLLLQLQTPHCARRGRSVNTLWAFCKTSTRPLPIELKLERATFLVEPSGICKELQGLCELWRTRVQALFISRGRRTRISQVEHTANQCSCGGTQCTSTILRGTCAPCRNDAGSRWAHYKHGSGSFSQRSGSSVPQAPDPTHNCPLYQRPQRTEGQEHEKRVVISHGLSAAETQRRQTQSPDLPVCGSGGGWRPHTGREWRGRARESKAKGCNAPPSGKWPRGWTSQAPRAAVGWITAGMGCPPGHMVNRKAGATAARHLEHEGAVQEHGGAQGRDHLVQDREHPKPAAHIDLVHEDLAERAVGHELVPQHVVHAPDGLARVLRHVRRLGDHGVVEQLEGRHRLRRARDGPDHRLRRHRPPLGRALDGRGGLGAVGGVAALAGPPGLLLFPEAGVVLRRPAPHRVALQAPHLRACAFVQWEGNHIKEHRPWARGRSLPACVPLMGRVAESLLCRQS